MTSGVPVTQDLKGRAFAVTGGFGALGRALGEVLRIAGAKVALIDKAPASQSPGAGFVAVDSVDLAQFDSARHALDLAAVELGGLDGLVNVAGGFHWETVEAAGAGTWDDLYMRNVRTALLASQAALPHLLARGRGRIVNVGSCAANTAGLGMGAYAAAKAGVAKLTEAMAEEFKDRGITVNAVLPTVIDTPANRASMPQSDASRWVRPDALAQVIAFLLSDAAAPITGALIPVKGRG